MRKIQSIFLLILEFNFKDTRKKALMWIILLNYFLHLVSSYQIIYDGFHFTGICQMLLPLTKGGQPFSGSISPCGCTMYNLGIMDHCPRWYWFSRISFKSSRSIMQLVIQITSSTTDQIREHLDQIVYNLLQPQIWNILPKEAKEAKKLNILKILIKKWTGPNCICSLCSNVLK